MPIATYTNFSGGINTQLPSVITQHDPLAWTAEPLYFEDGKNMELSERGIIKYKGASEVLDSVIGASTIITGIFPYRKSDGTIEFIGCAGGKVYRIAGGTATQLYTGDTAGKFYTGEQYNNVLILCNGTDAPLQYNGTTCAAITFTDPQSIFNSATPHTVALFRNRIWYADNTKIYSPKPGTHNDFDNSNNSVVGEEIDPGSGGIITGFISLTADTAIILKQTAVLRMNGSNPFGSGIDEIFISDVTRETGCIARRTVVQRGADVFFLSKGGIRQLSTVDRLGGVAPELQPTYAIQPWINTNLNFTLTDIDDACAVYNETDNRIYWSAPTGSNTTNNRLFVYDVMTRTNEFADTSNTFKVASIGIVNRVMYFGGYDGQFYQWNSGFAWGDSGVINSFCQTHFIAHHGISRLKRYRRLSLYAEGVSDTDIIIQWTLLRRGDVFGRNSTESIDVQSAWDAVYWDEFVWDAGREEVINIKNLGRGHAIKLRIINNTNDEQPTITTIELDYDVFGSVRG